MMVDLSQHLLSNVLPKLLLPLSAAEALLTPTETTVLWGLHHPYWLVAISVFLIISLQVTVSITGQLVRRIIKEIGRSPFSLGRWLVNKTTVKTTVKTTTRDVAPDQKLATILNQLSSLQEEQALLLTELKQHLPEEE